MRMETSTPGLPRTVKVGDRVRTKTSLRVGELTGISPDDRLGLVRFDGDRANADGTWCDVADLEPESPVP
jgi:hypothetical protein